MAGGPGARLLIDRGGTFPAPVGSVTAACAAPFLAAAKGGPGRDRAAAPAAPTLRLDRPLEQALAVVAEKRGGEAALARPALDRGWMGTEHLGNLRQRQEAASAQAGVSIGQGVLLAQVDDDSGGEPVGDARVQAARVEDLGDLRVGVAIEEPIDLGHDGGIGPPEIGGIAGQGQPDGPDDAAAEADVGDDLVSAHQGDVVEQQPDHALALPLRRGGVRPEPREVGGEGEDPGPRRRVDEPPIGLVPALMILLRRRERPQLVVPVGLERVRHQAVVGIDAEVPALGELGLIAGPLDLGPPEPVGLGRPGRELGLDAESGLERERTDGLDEELADRAIDRVADDPGARGPGVLDGLALAVVLGTSVPWAR